MDLFVRFPKDVFRLYDQLEPSALKVLLWLYNSTFYQNDNFIPKKIKKSEIVKNCSLSKNTVKKALNDLQTLGLIQIRDKLIIFEKGSKIDHNKKGQKLTIKGSKIDHKKGQKLTINEKKGSKIDPSTTSKATPKAAKRVPQESLRIYKEQKNDFWEMLFAENSFIKKLWNLHLDSEVIILIEKYGKNKDLDFQKQLEKNKEIARWARRLADISPDDDLSEENASLRIYVSNCLMDAMVGGINVNSRFVFIMKKLLKDGERIKYPRYEEVKKAHDLELLINAEYEHRKKETEKLIAKSEEKQKQVNNSISENDKIYEDNKDKYPDLEKEAKAHAFDLLRALPGTGKDIDHLSQLDNAKQAIFDRLMKSKFSRLLEENGSEM